MFYTQSKVVWTGFRRRWKPLLPPVARFPWKNCSQRFLIAALLRCQLEGVQAKLVCNCQDRDPRDELHHDESEEEEEVQHTSANQEMAEAAAAALLQQLDAGLQKFDRSSLCCHAWLSCREDFQLRKSS